MSDFYENLSLSTLHVELSTKCNASCPMCSRNNSGYGQNEKIKADNMSLLNLQSNLSDKYIAQLKRLIVCGNFGDPLMNPELVQIFEFFKQINPNLRIELHTNGGIGSREIWQKLAKLVSFCRFGIDGLEDTNHIYRRGVKWARLMENVRTFIESGGNAEWAFIVFKHNQHQVDKAIEISIELGFKKFIPKRSTRQILNTGEFVEKWPVYFNNTEIEYFIESAEDEKSKKNFSNFKNLAETEADYRNYLNSTTISCKVKSEKSIYLSVDGLVFPCCWLAINYTLQQSNKKSLKELMQRINTNEDGINLSKRSISEIISGPIFREIENSWNNIFRLQTCARVCGDGFDPFKSQF